MENISGTSEDASVPGVLAYNKVNGPALWAVSEKDRAGVFIAKAEGTGVWSESAEGRAGVFIAKSDGAGIWGESEKDRGGVFISKANGAGVWGESEKDRGGVFISKANGAGVWGESEKDRGGVFISKANGAGVWGESATGRGGVFISKASETGVHGISTIDGTGVVGESKKGSGVLGISADLNGLEGRSTNGNGLYAKSDHGNAAYFEGNVFVTGTLTAKVDIVLSNGDCAEEFNIGTDEMVEPGSVMVLDKEGALIPCQDSYDKKVAGIISGAGSYKPGIILDKQPESDQIRKAIALMGKVYCKVDATYGSIEIGDLLTTSDTIGYAMKASDSSKAFGAVIGKALQPLNSGKGLIPVLIALQ